MVDEFPPDERANVDVVRKCKKLDARWLKTLNSDATVGDNADPDSKMHRKKFARYGTSPRRPLSELRIVSLDQDQHLRPFSRTMLKVGSNSRFVITVSVALVLMMALLTFMGPILLTLLAFSSILLTFAIVLGVFALPYFLCCCWVYRQVRGYNTGPTGFERVERLSLIISDTIAHLKNCFVASAEKARRAYFQQRKSALSTLHMYAMRMPYYSPGISA